MRITQERVAAILLIAAVSATGCETTATFSGSATNTGVSGTSASNVETLSVDGGEYGIELIQWAEGGVGGGLDKPCYLKATFRSLNDALDTSDRHETVVKEVNVCGGGNFNNASMQTVANIAVRSPPDPLYVNGIAACDSRDNDNERIKGVQLYMAHINGVSPAPTEYECNVRQTDGSLVWQTCDATNPESVPFGTVQMLPVDVRMLVSARTNCGTWDNAVNCASGQIASAVRVHVSSDNEITGLGLSCDTVNFERED